MFEKIRGLFNSACSIFTSNTSTLSSGEAVELHRRVRALETDFRWLETYVYENIEKMNYVRRETAKKMTKETNSSMTSSPTERRKFGGQSRHLMGLN